MSKQPLKDGVKDISWDEAYGDQVCWSHEEVTTLGVLSVVSDKDTTHMEGMMSG